MSERRDAAIIAFVRFWCEQGWCDFPLIWALISGQREVNSAQFQRVLCLALGGDEKTLDAITDTLVIHQRKARAGHDA